MVVEDGCEDHRQDSVQFVRGVQALGVGVGLERDVEHLRREQCRDDVTHVANQVDKPVSADVVAFFREEVVGRLREEGLDLVCPLGGVQLLVDVTPLGVVRVWV